MTSTVCIGLGSNLQNPLGQVQQALTSLSHLPTTQVWKHSSLYRSAPLGPPGQPDYINAVAVLQTELLPLTLLEHLQAIEQRQGRVRTGERWGARTLDLDMLLYDNRQMQDPVLTLPHPHLYERAFVLYPLYECLPALILPDGQKLHDLVQRCTPVGLSLVK
ncbi:MAG: 2-amino-4-hydroxy-6-hydroxymethyldihydropteridine diphosphokinase [Beggiatoa sp. IS2]|nr:MAG: 2-amino-4-hydroxy-6-hydroxymethyldihydropteridine diphosphokinase [Beggiatoa sp. IS2]